MALKFMTLGDQVLCDMGITVKGVCLVMMTELPCCSAATAYGLLLSHCVCASQRCNVFFHCAHVHFFSL